jgi:hypothetical protein
MAFPRMASSPRPPHAVRASWGSAAVILKFLVGQDYQCSLEFCGKESQSFGSSFGSSSNDLEFLRMIIGTMIGEQMADRHHSLVQSLRFRKHFCLFIY